MVKKSLNGSVELLADAMRTVFSEAVKGATEPLHEDMKGLHEDMKGLHEDMKGLRTDMQGMGRAWTRVSRQPTKTCNLSFAEQEKKIGQLLKEPR